MITKKNKFMPAPMVRICLLFALFMALFHLALWLFTPGEGDPLRGATTGIVSSLLNAIGIANSADGTYISLRNAYWVVTPECTAVNVFILFTSFVLAYSASLKAKAIALACGIPFIFAVNIGRLVVLGWVTEHYPHYARFIHDYAWQAVFVLLVVMMWLTWIELVVNRENEAPLPR